MEVTTYDGRAYLNAVNKKYDVIMVDAYQDITIPFQMSSTEFFSLVRDHLKEDGVMVVNMNMRGTREGNINQYLSDTIASVFDTVYTVDVAHTTNRELFASRTDAGIRRFGEEAAALEDGRGLPLELAQYAPRRRRGASGCCSTGFAGRGRRTSVRQPRSCRHSAGR